MRVLLGIMTGAFIVFMGIFAFPIIKEFISSEPQAQITVETAEPLTVEPEIFADTVAESTETTGEASISDEIVADEVLTATTPPITSESAEVNINNEAEEGAAEPIEAEDRILPPNVHLYVVETTDYRLHQVDVDQLPSETILAIWPDSVMVGSGMKYYLITPPVDIMEAYALKNVVEDQEYLYEDTFEDSKGLFLRNIDILTEANVVSEHFYTAMAKQQKSVMAFAPYIAPDLNQTLSETQVDFDRIDYVIDATHGAETTQQQWDAILKKAENGEKLNIMINASEDGLAELEKAISNYFSNNN